MEKMLLFASGLSVAISFFVCVVSIYKKDTQKSAYFNLLAVATTFYLLGNFLEIASHSVEAAIVGVKVAYIGRPFIPALWFLCVREYCGKAINDIFSIAVIMFVPIVITILAYTWESNQLLFESFQYQSDKTISQLSYVQGPVYLLKQLYLYTFNALGFLTIFFSYLNGTKRFRQQAIFFFISMLIPVFTTASYVITIGTYYLDITAYGLSFTMVLFFWAMRHYGIENFSSIIKDSVIDSMHEGVIVFDKDGIYMESNKTIKEIFPEVKDVRIGTSISEMEYLPFDATILDSKDGHLKEFSRKSNDCIRTYSLSVAHVKQGSYLIGHSVIIYNITAFKSMLTELEVKAHTDNLTNIYNRGFFFEKSRYEIQQAKRANNPLSLIMFDLDHFKKINDNYGHPYGDYVLRTIALIGGQNLRKTDVFGRYGGEEFAVVLPNTNIEGAVLKAETVRKKIETYIFEFEGVHTKVTASFGVSELNKFMGEEALELMIKQADENLYKAKEQGRNRVVS
ncbi:histidine kinase N-terminal 7TM domain-containing diguanylate cyclase [Desulfovibrio litoralis]|uniref:diguanylate cyclase n=1 Tax=Desulfovibrio litoralis DSM 11393 TaxID=1121455 RepID=A0A1M7RYR2_9BACT|nr:diguanylate cyclase [Desulfovibrio litoralis]SHN51477.1 diguanylate cyclase (GGDEF) domain-containing protein [Desulfovibrio litoralis DSM 11393]